MRQIPTYILIMLACLLTAGCNDEMPDTARTHAVIEAYISQGGTPEVFFTTSVSPSQAGKINDVVVRWGKVTITDGRDTVIMTGGPLKGSFPPFHYYTPMITGKAGTTYTVTAEYDGIYATAKATIPEPTPVDSIIVHAVEGCDTLCSATLWFTAPAVTPAYYYISVLEDYPGARPLPAYLGTVTADHPGMPVSMPVYRPKYKYGAPKDYVPQLKRGARYQISLCRVEKPVYEFWNSYSSTVAFGSGSLFINSTVSLSGNVTGGYGIFSAQAQSQVTITATPDNTQNQL